MPDYLPTLAEAPVAAAIPGELERRQRERIAAALMAQGSSGEPIAHWAQGLNRVAQGLVGGYQLGELRRQADAEEAATQAILSRGLHGLGGGETPAGVAPYRAAETEPPAATPAPPAPRPAMSPNALGYAALSDPGVMAGRPDQNRFLDISTRVPTGYTLPADPGRAAYTLPTDRTKVASTDRVVGDDEGVRLGYYDPPAAAGARPPNQPDVAAGQPPTQMAQAARQPQAAPSPAVHPTIAAELELGRALALNRPTRVMGLQMYSKALQAAQPNYGFQVIGDKIFRTDPRTGRIEDLGGAPAKPTYGVIGEDQFGNKQYGWIDPATRSTTSGTAGRTGTGGTAAGGTAGEPVRIAGPDGTLHTVPPNQDPKKFRDTLTTITAEAVGGKATEGQSKASRFANRMENAEPGIGQTEKAGLDFFQKRAGELPYDVGRYAQTEQRQRYDTFKGQWISGFLRADSGAVINPSEYRDADNQFFPQPNDTPKIIAEKREARRVATEAMKKEAGPGYRSPTPAPTTPTPTTAQGDPVAQARAAIAAGAPKAKVIERLRQNGIAPPSDL